MHSLFVLPFLFLFPFQTPRHSVRSTVTSPPGGPRVADFRQLPFDNIPTYQFIRLVLAPGSSNQWRPLTILFYFC